MVYYHRSVFLITNQTTIIYFSKALFQLDLLQVDFFMNRGISKSQPNKL